MYDHDHVCIRGIEEWAMYILDSPLPVTMRFRKLAQTVNFESDG